MNDEKNVPFSGHALLFHACLLRDYEIVFLTLIEISQTTITTLSTENRTETDETGISSD